MDEMQVGSALLLLKQHMQARLGMLELTKGPHQSKTPRERSAKTHLSRRLFLSTRAGQVENAFRGLPLLLLEALVHSLVQELGLQLCQVGSTNLASLWRESAASHQQLPQVSCTLSILECFKCLSCATEFYLTRLAYCGRQHKDVWLLVAASQTVLLQCTLIPCLCCGSDAADAPQVLY